MEHITDRVKPEVRETEVLNVLEECVMFDELEITHSGLGGNVEHLRAYISRLVQMAYLAGTRHVDTNKGHDRDLETPVGTDVVLARNYAKDKGFPV